MTVYGGWKWRFLSQTEGSNWEQENKKETGRKGERNKKDSRKNKTEARR